MKKHKPKRAKLITNGGFYKTIDIKTVDYKIHIMYPTKIQLNSPELYGMSVTVTHDVIFTLHKVTKTLATYTQSDAVLLDN